MSDVLQDLIEQYTSALEEYLRGKGESALHHAYELGRKALENGLGILDIVTIHREAMVKVIAGALSPEESMCFTKQATDFLTECLSPFEMTQRGFKEANASLRAEIVERKRMEKILIQLREEALSVSKAKSDFLANMSHELRTPLNAIIGFSEVLFDQKFGPLNERQKDYLGDILESGKHLLSLINDILDLAKVESGKIELVFSNFSLREILEHSLNLIKEKALKHNIELSLDITEEVGYIRADERKFKQIVFNLLSNAVKFTPDGGKAGIQAKMINSEVEVAVWDTGIGISREDQAKLFKDFAQLETGLTKKYEGTGLGLSLTKKLVELHKGKIWVESEGRGKGSTFKFTLPIKREV
jgi:signal transduction histidine kinase